MAKRKKPARRKPQGVTVASDDHSEFTKPMTTHQVERLAALEISNRQQAASLKEAYGDLNFLLHMIRVIEPNNPAAQLKAGQRMVFAHIDRANSQRMLDTIIGVESSPDKTNA